MRLEGAEVIVVAPLLDLGPRSAVVGDFARLRPPIVDVQRNQVTDLHPIVMAGAVDFARVRWRRQGQQINRRDQGFTQFTVLCWVDYSTADAFVHRHGGWRPVFRYLPVASETRAAPLRSIYIMVFSYKAY